MRGDRKGHSSLCERLRGQMKVRIALIGMTVILAIISAGSGEHVSAQKRDRFLHSTAAHKKKDCNSCHTVPTTNWPAARGYPDVANYPSHAACFACHQKDIFSGNRPVFCGTCHVSAGPSKAPMLAFPLRTRSQEFSTVFPHNIHQDIIASDRSRRQNVAVAHFVNVAFVRAADDPPKFNNCAICHQTTAQMPKFASRVATGVQPLLDSVADPFVPKAGFFRDDPRGHQTCFACHFQGPKPEAKNCAGCHQLTTEYSEARVVKRYSPKFDHLQKDHAGRDCMSCHIRISQNADVKTLVNADVPIITCNSCHEKNIVAELGLRAESLKSAQPFQCKYCHTAELGRFPVPKSHENR